MKTYKVSYSGNCFKFRNFEAIVNASTERDAVERIYAGRLDYNYFPQENGSVKDCGGNIIALPTDDSIEYDGGFFYAKEII